MTHESLTPISKTCKRSTSCIWRIGNARKDSFFQLSSLSVKHDLTQNHEGWRALPRCSITPPLCCIACLYRICSAQHVKCGCSQHREQKWTHQLYSQVFLFLPTPGIQLLKATQHTDKHQAKHPGWLSPTENPTRSAATEHFRNLALVVNPNENHENLTLKVVSFKGTVSPDLNTR